MEKKPLFEIGDLVRLKTGNSPLVILEVRYFALGPENSMYWRWPYHRKENSYRLSGLCREASLGQKKGFYIRSSYTSQVGFSHQGTRRWREIEDYVIVTPVTSKPEPKKEEIQMDVLYQTKEEKPRFGIHRGVNGKGQFILEMKGIDSNYEAFPQDAIEEVLPYTVHLEPLIKEDNGSKHVIATEEQVSLQDVLLELNTGRFWLVTAMNTKCRTPQRNKSKWMKVPLESITLGDDN